MSMAGHSGGSSYFVLKIHSVYGSAVMAWLSWVLCSGSPKVAIQVLPRAQAPVLPICGLCVSSSFSLLAKIQVLVVMGLRSHFLAGCQLFSALRGRPLPKHFTHGCLISSAKPAWVSGKALCMIPSAARVENHAPGIHKCLFCVLNG